MAKAERHGAILKTMLTKYDMEHPITQYHELSQAIFWCIQAKNSSSLKRGYAPEVLVLGKHTRLPGAVCSDEMLPAHLLAESEAAHGVAFHRQLAYRELARKAFAACYVAKVPTRGTIILSRRMGHVVAPRERASRGFLESWCVKIPKQSGQPSPVSCTDALQNMSVQ